MNEKLEQLLNSFRDTKFAQRIARKTEDKVDRKVTTKALRRKERQLRQAITSEFMNVTDAEYAKHFNAKMTLFETDFTFNPDAMSEEEFV